MSEPGDVYAVLGVQLTKLYGEFKAAFKRLEGLWLSNFENAHRDVLRVIGTVVEDFLRRLSDPDGWPMPAKAAIRGRDDAVQRQKLGMEIVKALKAVSRFRRQMQSSMGAYWTAEIPPPDFVDFRAKHDSIKAPIRSKALAKA
jgi:hypothetical protein